MTHLTDDLKEQIKDLNEEVFELRQERLAHNNKMNLVLGIIQEVGPYISLPKNEGKTPRLACNIRYGTRREGIFASSNTIYQLTWSFRVTNSYGTILKRYVDFFNKDLISVNIEMKPEEIYLVSFYSLLAVDSTAINLASQKEKEALKGLYS